MHSSPTRFCVISQRLLKSPTDDGFFKADKPPAVFGNSNDWCGSEGEPLIISLALLSLLAWSCLLILSIGFVNNMGGKSYNQAQWYAKIDNRYMRFDPSSRTCPVHYGARVG